MEIEYGMDSDVESDVECDTETDMETVMEGNHLRSSARAGDLGGAENSAVPGDSDSAGEGNLGMEGAGFPHVALHHNVHARGRWVGDVLFVQEL